MERFRSRGGSVKVNCILSEPPRYEGVPAEQAELLLSTGIALCPSIDYLERAWQDATRGEPAEGPTSRSSSRAPLTTASPTTAPSL